MKRIFLLALLSTLLSCTKKQVAFTDNPQKRLMDIKQQLSYEKINSELEVKTFNWGNRWTLRIGDDKIKGQLGNGKSYELNTLELSIEHNKDGKKSVNLSFLEANSKPDYVKKQGQIAFFNTMFYYIGGKEDWNPTYQRILNSLPLDESKKYTISEGPLEPYSEYIEYTGDNGFIFTMRNWKKE